MDVSTTSSLLGPNILLRRTELYMDIDHVQATICRIQKATDIITESDNSRKASHINESEV
jgi:hypothetical protein